MELSHLSLSGLLLLGSWTALRAQTFDGPAHIPFESTKRVLWGDMASGRVHDSFYVKSDKIYQLIYGMAPGEVYRHSDRFPTLFTTDAVYYVLSGTLIVNNPATGEVQRVEPGEAVFLPRNAWNYGFSYSDRPLRVLEYYIPPPAEEEVSASGTVLGNPKYHQDQWFGRWPQALDEARQDFGAKVVRKADIWWRLEGKEKQVLVGIMASSSQLTVGRIELLPGQETEIRRHGGDLCLYLEKGEAHVRLPDEVINERGEIEWFDVREGDGVFIPEGTRHQYYNTSDRPAIFVFGLAPGYLVQR